MTFIYHLIIASYFPIHDFFSFIYAAGFGPAALWAGRNLPVILLFICEPFYMTALKTTGETFHFEINARVVNLNNFS